MIITDIIVGAAILLFVASLGFGIVVQVMVSIVGMLHLQKEPTSEKRARLVSVRLHDYDLDEDN